MSMEAIDVVIGDLEGQASAALELAGKLRSLYGRAGAEVEEREAKGRKRLALPAGKRGQAVPDPTPTPRPDGRTLAGQVQRGKRGGMRRTSGSGGQPGELHRAMRNVIGRMPAEGFRAKDAARELPAEMQPKVRSGLFYVQLTKWVEQGELEKVGFGTYRKTGRWGANASAGNGFNKGEFGKGTKRRRSLGEPNEVEAGYRELREGIVTKAEEGE